MKPYHIEFHGEQFGARVVLRKAAPNDLVQIISEDDGNWLLCGSEFDAGWIDDLIMVLQAAKGSAKIKYIPGK